MKLIPFVDFASYNTQNGFGQYDRQYYPATGHHIGSDFRVQVGTPILAPCDGEMFKAVPNEFRGNTGIFIFEYDGTTWGLEFCHLRVLPKLGKFKQGQQIAVSGATGSASTGPHLHVTMHRDATVTKNYSELVNEEAFIRLWKSGRLADPIYYFWQRI